MHILEQFQLDRRVAIVTGGAMGLGKAMAEALAQAGADIVIFDIRMDTAREAAAELSAYGTNVTAFEVDVTDEQQVIDAVRKVDEQYGRIDILLNNAGIAHLDRAEELTYTRWKQVMDINLNSVFLMSREVGKAMIREKKGSIINISSMSGIIVNTPQPQSAYNASKAGVIMLTKSLASEWVGFGVRVNTIAPGYMLTKLTEPYFERKDGMVQQWLDRRRWVDPDCRPSWGASPSIWLRMPPRSLRAGFST
jgi:NAD(P)-dependent dehydrogenase (short-subunit alcohol dehydrogenase family)